jgi:hypothetical protein
MTKRKYGFILTQKGAPELARNLNEDYTFKVPVQASTDCDDYMQSLYTVTHIYYHSDEGWIPMVDGKNSSWGHVTLSLSDDDAHLLWQMAQSLGDKAISKMFNTIECIWKAAPQEFTITDEDIL